MSSNDPSTPDVPQRASERSEDFRRELEHLINRHSQESMGGNTPDFILAEYLNNCLHVFDQAVRARNKWYNASHEPGRVDRSDAKTNELLAASLLGGDFDYVTGGDDSPGC